MKMKPTIILLTSSHCLCVLEPGESDPLLSEPIIKLGADDVVFFLGGYIPAHCSVAEDMHEVMTHEGHIGWLILSKYELDQL